MLRPTLVALLICSASAVALAQPVAWPTIATTDTLLRVDAFRDAAGHTNSLPDFVGPLDGSARLTVFTEGNHLPVLLPLLFERLPAWSAARGAPFDPASLLVVTLPQTLIVGGLESGGFRLGNARLPVRPDGAVYPDVIMLGRPMMRRLAAAGIVPGEARVLARHRGLGLLLRRDRAGGIGGFSDLAASPLRIVTATEREGGARVQYRTTAAALLGEARAASLWSREIPRFTGQLGIQHRDVPYALLNDFADGGVLFGHLARHWAERFPEQLAFVPVPEAERFGEEILVAPSAARADRSAGAMLLAFLREVAPAAYETGGFTAADRFGFWQSVDLRSP